MAREFELLRQDQVRKIRINPGSVPYGTVEHSTAKRKCRCRACGEVMCKGDPRITFQWDFRGSGSWTAVESHMHFDDCTGAVKEFKTA